MKTWLAQPNGTMQENQRETRASKMKRNRTIYVRSDREGERPDETKQKKKKRHENDPPRPVSLKQVHPSFRSHLTIIVTFSPSTEGDSSRTSEI